MDLVEPVQAIIPGVQGRILAVLAETSAELSLRTIARLAGVSIAQASRVMPKLVELGMVARREVPPSALFRLVEDHVASRAVLALAGARRTVLEELGQAAGTLAPAPLSVIVFGSFARGEARADSDIDVVVVKPAEVAEEDQAWGSGLEGWRRHARRITGNRAEIVEVDEREVARLLASRKPLWANVVRDGLVIFGRPLRELKIQRSA
ncbi:MAG TPA: nucleotidyltransferase domain-containing protein [Actinomycetota bacterium]